MYRRISFIYFIFMICFLKAQSSSEKPFSIKKYQMSSEKYISGVDGKVYMNVNFWGMGGSGTIQVQEGTDFASLMSLVGVSTQFANFKKIRLYREIPDENGQLVYLVDLTSFLKSGDRSNFPKIKPNDTIVIKKTWIGILLEDLSTVQTLLTAFTLILQFNAFIN